MNCEIISWYKGALLSEFWQTTSHLTLVSTSHTTGDMAIKELTLLAFVAVAVFCTVSASKYHNHGKHYGKNGLISYITYQKLLKKEFNAFSLFHNNGLGDKFDYMYC